MKSILEWGLDIVWLDFWNAGSNEETQIWNMLKQLNGNKRTMIFGRHYTRPNQFNEEKSPYGQLGYDNPPNEDAIEKTMPVHWNGDQQGSWSGFMEAIEGIVYGIDGVMDGWSYLHSDTPGHIGGEDPELANRWIQFSDFSPITRNHGASARDVWSWGSKVEENSRFSRMLRYRLLPYIYTGCWQIYEKAIPLTRPLRLAYPGQRDDIRYQYMFGDLFLVAPVYQTHNFFDGEQMDVYLPSSEDWVDYWTHQIFHGGQVVKVNVSEANDKYVPLYVKRGAIIPMGPELYFIQEDVHPNPLTLDIYPLKAGESAFTLYDDDGKSLEYQQGKSAQTTFLCSKSDQEIAITIYPTVGSYAGMSNSQDYILKINLVNINYVSVTKNDVPLLQIPDYKDLLSENATHNQWAMDASNKIMYARIKTSVNEKSVIIFKSEPYTAILTRIEVLPSQTVLILESNVQFNIAAYDQNNYLMEITPTWLSSGDSITSSGLFTAKYEGKFTVTAKKDEIEATAEVFVEKPTVFSGHHYKITARHSQKVLDVSGGSTVNGAQIQQFDDNATPSQSWKITNLGYKTYKLEAECSGKALEVSNCAMEDGGRIQQWEFNNLNSQKWSIIAIGDGYFKIINLNSAKALDVEGSSKDSGAVTHQWTYLGQQNQQWTLTLLK